MQFQGMNAEDARAFAERWLPAWSGNRAALLASFAAHKNARIRTAQFDLSVGISKMG